MVLDGVSNSITSFGNTLINWLNTIISGFSDVLLVLYTFLLLIVFFLLQAGFIYVYFKIGQFISKIVPIISGWFDLNKDRFSSLLNRK